MALRRLMGMENAELFAEKIRQLREYLHKRNGRQLKLYADECSQLALVQGEPRFIILCSIAYSFAKFYEKAYISASPELERLSGQIQFDLAKANELLLSNDEPGFDSTLSQSEAAAKDLSASLGRHIVNVVSKARIKTAANVYAHGASLGTAARLCGVGKDELSEYIGHTTMSEKYRTMSVGERMQKVYAALGR